MNLSQYWSLESLGAKGGRAGRLGRGKSQSGWGWVQELVCCLYRRVSLVEID